MKEKAKTKQCSSHKSTMASNLPWDSPLPKSPPGSAHRVATPHTGGANQNNNATLAIKQLATQRDDRTRRLQILQQKVETQKTDMCTKESIVEDGKPNLIDCCVAFVGFALLTLSCSCSIVAPRLFVLVIRSLVIRSLVIRSLVIPSLVIGSRHLFSRHSFSSFVLVISSLSTHIS